MKPKTRNRKIAIMLIVCMIAGIATVSGIIVYARTEPSRAVGRAILQMAYEFNERIQNSPLQAASLLRNTDGTANIHFTRYVRHQSMCQENAPSRTADINISTVSRGNDRATTIVGQTNIGTIEKIDISIRNGTNWIAVNMPTLGSYYYGITYGSFRRDMEPLKRYQEQIGINIEAVANVVDWFNPLLHRQDGAVMQAIDYFLSNTEQPLRAATHNGTQAIRTAYRGSLKDIFMLFEPVAVLAPQTMAASFMPNAAANFELAFYTTSLNRLMRITLEARTLINDVRHGMEASIDFGTGATDNWRFNIAVTDESGNRNTLDVRWGIRATRSQTTHELAVTTCAGRQTQTTRYVLQHNRSNGNFSLNRTRSNPSRTETLATGSFSTRNHGGRNQPEPLTFNFMLNAERSIAICQSEHTIISTLAITTTGDDRIPHIAFINADEWVQTILRGMQRWKHGQPPDLRHAMTN